MPFIPFVSLITCFLGLRDTKTLGLKCNLVHLWCHAGKLSWNMILEEIHRTYQSVFMATVNKSVIREPCQLWERHPHLVHLPKSKICTFKLPRHVHCVYIVVWSTLWAFRITHGQRRLDYDLLRGTFKQTATPYREKSVPSEHSLALLEVEAYMS
jgi:hypothetical protein